MLLVIPAGYRSPHQQAAAHVEDPVKAATVPIMGGRFLHILSRSAGDPAVFFASVLKRSSPAVVQSLASADCDGDPTRNRAELDEIVTAGDLARPISGPLGEACGLACSRDDPDARSMLAAGLIVRSRIFHPGALDLQASTALGVLTRVVRPADRSGLLDFVAAHAVVANRSWFDLESLVAVLLVAIRQEPPDDELAFELASELSRTLRSDGPKQSLGGLLHFHLSTAASHASSDAVKTALGTLLRPLA